MPCRPSRPKKGGGGLLSFVCFFRVSHTITGATHTERTPRVSRTLKTSGRDVSTVSVVSLLGSANLQRTFRLTIQVWPRGFWPVRLRDPSRPPTSSPALSFVNTIQSFGSPAVALERNHIPVWHFTAFTSARGALHCFSHKEALFGEASITIIGILYSGMSPVCKSIALTIPAFFPIWSSAGYQKRGA